MANLQRSLGQCVTSKILCSKKGPDEQWPSANLSASSVFVNKVLLEHSYIHLLMCYL